MGQGAERFVAALKEAEQARRPEPLVDVFAEEAELWSVARPQPRHGKDGAREFWSDYLDAFEEVRSEFKSVVERDGRAALEWESDATLAGGREIHYAGVTVLELEGDRVVRFRTYFDPTPFLDERPRQPAA